MKSPRLETQLVRDHDVRQITCGLALVLPWPTALGCLVISARTDAKVGVLVCLLMVALTLIRPLRRSRWTAILTLSISLFLTSASAFALIAHGSPGPLGALGVAIGVLPAAYEFWLGRRLRVPGLLALLAGLTLALLAVVGWIIELRTGSLVWLTIMQIIWLFVGLAVVVPSARFFRRRGPGAV